MRLLGGDTKVDETQEVTVHPVARSETCWALPNVYGLLNMSSTQLTNWISAIMLIYMFLETCWLMNPLPLFSSPLHEYFETSMTSNMAVPGKEASLETIP